MEEWRDIPGYEGLYQASTHGRIRTHENKITSNALYKERHWKQRILKQKIHPNAKGRIDPRVCLWKNNKEKTWLVSRLIALTWVNGYASGLTVNHIDGNPLNNRFENLEWVTLGENVMHAFRTGLMHTCHKVVLQNSEKTTVYNSMSEASRAIGRCTGYVSLCIKNNRDASGSDGTVYKILA